MVNYGLDAFPIIRNFFIVGFICIFTGIFLYLFFHPIHLIFTVLIALLVAYGILDIIFALLMIYTSKYSKKTVIKDLIKSLHLKGNEIVLDVGCGRGLLAITVAKELTSGKVIGIDIWRNEDQSNNSLTNSQKNAATEHVSERIEFLTRDMRDLQFPDNSFDLVVSSLAIHNLPDKNDRDKAIKEIVRTLKSGGRFMILDFQCIDEYAATLRKLGCALTISDRNYKMFPPVKIIQGNK